MFLPVPPSELIDCIIKAIKDALTHKIPFTEYVFTYISTNYTLFDMLFKHIKNASLKPSDSKKFIQEIIDIAPLVILEGLNIDEKGRDCWSIFNQILKENNYIVEFKDMSKIIHEGRKIDKNWKTYALTRLEQINMLITPFDMKQHSVNILPYTDAPIKNIRIFHGKELLILFRLIKENYPEIRINSSMCFRFDDIDVSMKCLSLINKESPNAYSFISHILIQNKCLE